MRGKLCNLKVIDCNPRITPADAGKTASRPRLSLHTWDHPRGCGENRYVPDRRQRRIGSPPRMRGKLCPHISADGFSGITPADAGKTLPAAQPPFQSRDHPRGCGENRRAKLAPIHIVGSPPRMRGKHANQLAIIAGFRITPADAGKTVRHMLMFAER